MVLESDGATYVRNTMGMIYSKFEVPLGASYACGNNSHNIFRRSQTETEDAIWFSGIQVHVHSFMCVIDYIKVAGK